MNEVHPIEFAAVVAVGLASVARVAVVAGVALVLVLAGWCPSPAAAAQPAQPAPAPVAVAAPMAELPADRMDYMTVAQLRLVARAAGFKVLARSGRRAELLAALA